MLFGLREKLMAPELLAEFIAEFQRERPTNAWKPCQLVRDRSEMAKVRKEIANIIAAIKEGYGSIRA